MRACRLRGGDAREAAQRDDERPGGAVAYRAIVGLGGETLEVSMLGASSVVRGLVVVPTRPLIAGRAGTPWLVDERLGLYRVTTRNVLRMSGFSFMNRHEQYV